MDSRMKWNTKHKERLAEKKAPTVNPRLKSLSSYLCGGRGLDIACGLGGNSLFLAQMNYQVEAIDISDVAISYVQEQATKRHLSIQPRVYDLTDFNSHSWQKHCYDLVVITYYLDRSILPTVKSMIKEGGYFFMETFYQSEQHVNQKVSDQYKLRSNELLSEFKDWKVLFFEENEQEGRQTIFCEKL
jgi:tellurite methyltransferase